VFLMASFIKYVGVWYWRRARTCFLHSNRKGVEIVQWQRKRCTRQSALIVGRNVKFRSSLTQAGRFTAESVGLREEIREEGSRLS
jgi:hypothetical protein